MAVSIDWATRVINVPKADMLLVQSTPIEIRQLDLNAFRLELKSLEYGVQGAPFQDTHRHNTTVTVGGVTLARVLEIINGYTVTFENGSYAVNLVGANSNVGDVVNLNTVSVRSANSAGLTYSKEIEDQSFTDGRIYVDTIYGSPGTQYPLGTTTAPVNNYVDAVQIAISRGLPNKYLYKGSTVVGAGFDVTDFDILGSSLPHDSITFTNTITEGTALENVMISGSVSGSFTSRNCVLMNLSGFNGFLFGGAIGGTLTLASGEAHLVNTHAAASGNNFVTIDFNGVDVDAFIPGWEGNMHVLNHSHAGALTAIDMKAGSITIDSSCTNGTIVVRGVGLIVDNSGSNCTVDTSGLVMPDNITDIFKIHGLDSSTTLKVTDTSRKVNDGTTDVIDQTISDDGTTTTVTRQ